MRRGALSDSETESAARPSPIRPGAVNHRRAWRASLPESAYSVTCVLPLAIWLTSNERASRNVNHEGVTFTPAVRSTGVPPEAGTP